MGVLDIADKKITEWKDKLAKTSQPEFWRGEKKKRTENTLKGHKRHIGQSEKI